MKLPHVLPRRPMPRMPEIAGFTPRFDPIPDAPNAQLVEGIRPLYWWAHELGCRGDILVNLRFDTATQAATVTVRRASYQVATVVRRHDNKTTLPRDLATLIAEGVWRLGSLGWTSQLRAVSALLSRHNLIVAAAPVTRCTRALPGWVTQPDSAVRMAYWWAVALKGHGWKLYACGDQVARGGFIAAIPNAAGGTDLVVYPGDMPDDGTEASALANHLAQLAKSQRAIVEQVIDDTATGGEQVS